MLDIDRAETKFGEAAKDCKVDVADMDFEQSKFWYTYILYVLHLIGMFTLTCTSGKSLSCSLSFVKNHEGHWSGDLDQPSLLQ